MMSNRATQVSDLFNQIDRQTAAFRQATGLYCPSGCGRCCENPDVDATILDCLPLAIALFQQDKADYWLAALDNQSGKQCLFYQAEPDQAGKGQCGVYPWRPSLCRLFGYATVRNKQGQPELAACTEQKTNQSATVKTCQSALADGLTAPNFADFAMRLAAIDPTIGQQRLPINQAVKLALEYVGFQLQFSDLTDLPE